MPYTKKQKRVGCAIEHGAKLSRVSMPLDVAADMCHSKLRRAKRSKPKKRRR